MDLNFDFQPVQAKLYELYEFSEARKIGFGGSRGGTKSYTSDMVMILRRIKYPGTNGIMIMKVYQDIWDIHLTPLFQKFPELAKSFNKAEMKLTLPKGSYVRFLSGDNLKEFQERKGREFADVFVDQSELFKQEELEFLGTINRSTDLKIVPKMLFCFNPGNISHNYHKRIFYEKIYESNERAEDFAFLQTYGWDNAYWCQKSLIEDKLNFETYHGWDSETRFQYFITRSDYGRILNSLPESKRKAELLGDMNIFEGMFFSEFRREKHVIDNYEFRSTWNTCGGLDYGNVTVLEVLQRDYEGNIICFDECYLPDSESPSERANLIADFLLEKGYHKLRIIYDTNMDISQISNVGYDKTPIQIFRKIFHERMGDKAPGMVVVSKNNLNRKQNYRQGVNEAVKEFLHLSNNKAKLFIHQLCKYLIKEMTTFIHEPDSNGMDFVHDNSVDDHAFDGFKYPFYALIPPKYPKSDKVEYDRQGKRKSKSIKTISTF